MAIFVTGAAPSEVVRARVRKVHRRHVEADLIAVQSASADRVVPRCPHFEEGCGGCCWQHVTYPAQLAAKAATVRDSLERLGGFRELPIRPIIPAPEAYNYRNKMEFAFHPNGILGLHPRGAWYDILRLRECLLGSPTAVAIVKVAQEFVESQGISLYHPRARQGLLRELCVRESRSTGEILVGIVTSPGDFPEAQAMAAHLAKVDPRIAGVVRSIRSEPEGAATLHLGKNPERVLSNSRDEYHRAKPDGTHAPLQGKNPERVLSNSRDEYHRAKPDGTHALDTTVLHGQDHITEIVGSLRFRIHMETFFQTNSVQAERLVDVVKDFAGDVDGVQVVDVYCGVGLFSLALAAAGARVVGVEIVEAAIKAARRNAAENGLASLSFHAGDARKVLAEVLPAGLAPKVLVLDPPRAGAGGKVMRRIARACPERIVYVSCNPTTLARDLVELRPFGYEVTAVQPIDLFPQTYHVETVVALECTREASKGAMDPGK